MTPNFEPNFSDDWFTDRAILGPGNWKTHVVPLLRDVENVQWVEVGSHEGRSALWAVDNLLHGPKARIVCIDPWVEPWLQNKRERAFDANTSGTGRILKLKGFSQNILPHLKPKWFHGAYIDGEHSEEAAYRDAILTLPLLLPGAVLIFDDYEGAWPDGSEYRTQRLTYGVKAAVDRFLKEQGERLKVVYRGWQIILQLVS